MKNNSNAKFWVIVIIVALVAGLLGSFIGGKMTGNVIKVQPAKIGQDVYTKAESDQKLNSVIESIMNNYPACAKYISIKNNGQATEVSLNGKYYKFGISTITPDKAALIVYSRVTAGLSVGETYDIPETNNVIKMKSVYYDSKDTTRSAVTITLDDC